MPAEKKQLTIKSSHENLHLIERFVDDICDEYNIHNNYFGNIIVAITEAVENAITHGNKNDAQKDIRITFLQKPRGFAFLIKDEGEGFDYNNISDPTEAENDLDAEKGRGVFLMCSLADQITFSDDGSEVELLFYISSINKELALFRIQKLKEFSGIKESSSTKTL